MYCKPNKHRHLFLSQQTETEFVYVTHTDTLSITVTDTVTSTTVKDVPVYRTTVVTEHETHTVTLPCRPPLHRGYLAPSRKYWNSDISLE